MSKKDFEYWRLIIYVLGLISILISILYILEIGISIEIIFIICGAILFFDGLISILLQMKDGILFQLGRMFRIIIAIFILLYGFSFVYEKAIFLFIGIIAITFGIVGKIPKKNIRLDIGKKPVSTKSRKQ